MPNIEELLRKAMQEGKFDNLPGKGKRLNLDETNPHADPEWELAYHIIKDAGYSLPWIEAIREIEKDIEAARKDLQLAWEWRLAGLAKQEPQSFLEAEWKRSKVAFQEKIIKLNKRIRDYNLDVPNARFQRPVLNIEVEFGKLTG